MAPAFAGAIVCGPSASHATNCEGAASSSRLTDAEGSSRDCNTSRTCRQNGAGASAIWAANFISSAGALEGLGARISFLSRKTGMVARGRASTLTTPVPPCRIPNFGTA
jgi:hypothetical protein